MPQMCHRDERGVFNGLPVQKDVPGLQGACSRGSENCPSDCRLQDQQIAASALFVQTKVYTTWNEVGNLTSHCCGSNIAARSLLLEASFCFTALSSSGVSRARWDIWEYPACLRTQGTCILSPDTLSLQAPPAKGRALMPGVIGQTNLMAILMSQRHLFVNTRNIAQVKVGSQPCCSRLISGFSKCRGNAVSPHLRSRVWLQSGQNREPTSILGQLHLFEYLKQTFGVIGADWNYMFLLVLVDKREKKALAGTHLKSVYFLGVPISLC